MDRAAVERHAAQLADQLASGRPKHVVGALAEDAVRACAQSSCAIYAGVHDEIGVFVHREQDPCGWMASGNCTSSRSHVDRSTFLAVMMSPVFAASLGCMLAAPHARRRRSAEG